VIIPLLRHVRPQRRVSSILRWEGIVIDPIGAVLAVLVFEVIREPASATRGDLLVLLAKSAAIGVGFGLGAGAILVRLAKRFLIPDYLHGAVFLVAALGVFALSNLLQSESGLVTITIMGIYLANQKQVSMRHVAAFKEPLAVLLVACLFIVLGARIDPRRLVDLGWPGLAFVAALILVIRPACVVAATLFSKITWGERCFIAFLAPRGIVAAAVTSVFALEVSRLAAAFGAAGDAQFSRIAEQAQLLVPITFLVIVSTVTVYGLLAGPLARCLELADPNPQGLLLVGADPWAREMAKALADEDFPMMLLDTNFRNVAEARLAGLNAHCVSALSDQVREEFDFPGIGRLLAVTGNDEVNSLCALEYAHIFDRAHIFQLPPSDERTGVREPLSARLRARLLFHEKATHRELSRRFAAGERIKKTRLTEEFTFDDFHRLYGESAIILFILEPPRKLIVWTTEKNPAPRPGQTLVAMVKPA
jgi:hypothetical protein